MLRAVPILNVKKSSRRKTIINFFYLLLFNFCTVKTSRLEIEDEIIPNTPHRK